MVFITIIIGVGRFRIFGGGGGARFRILGREARFRILGGQGLEFFFWGGVGGARFRILGGGGAKV